mmetsp:Transcript_7823/g.30880  ORF Transcript_7823/g.30880 Transcript_7823/m.30880 type:complete len:260 (-) Transcript_7823:61-840(-)
MSEACLSVRACLSRLGCGRRFALFLFPLLPTGTRSMLLALERPLRLPLPPWQLPSLSLLSPFHRRLARAPSPSPTRLPPSACRSWLPWRSRCATLPAPPSVRVAMSLPSSAPTQKRRTLARAPPPLAAPSPRARLARRAPPRAPRLGARPRGRSRWSLPSAWRHSPLRPSGRTPARPRPFRWRARSSLARRSACVPTRSASLSPATTSRAPGTSSTSEWAREGTRASSRCRDVALFSHSNRQDARGAPARVCGQCLASA